MDEKTDKKTDDRYFNIQSLAAYTGFSTAYYYQMVSEKRLPFGLYRFGRTLRFKKSEVDSWIETHRKTFVEGN